MTLEFNQDHQKYKSVKSLSVASMRSVNRSHSEWSPSNSQRWSFEEAQDIKSKMWKSFLGGGDFVFMLSSITNPVRTLYCSLISKTVSRKPVVNQKLCVFEYCLTFCEVYTCAYSSVMHDACQAILSSRLFSVIRQTKWQIGWLVPFQFCQVSAKRPPW